MLRAVRLEQRLGFLIEPRTLELLEEALPMLIRVSGERIHSELIQIFQEPRLSEIMSRLQELDLLEAIHPSLSWNQWMEDSFQRSKEFEAAEAWGLARQPREESLYYALWFSQLSEEEAESVCVKLHLPTDVKKCILETNRLMKELPELCLEGQPSTFVAVMQGLQEDALVATWLGLHEHPKCRKAIDQFLSQWRSVSPYATGDTLRELGLPPGPAYGRIIDALRKAWLDGRVNSAEEEDRLLGKLVAEEKGD
jgi:tRNA nucleotidyltransferase (CCA-adding enzyme)